MTTPISRFVSVLQPAHPEPKALPRSTGNPVLDQLDTNNDGVVNGFEHDIFLESEMTRRPAGTAAPPPGMIAELFPSPEPDVSK